MRKHLYRAKIFNGDSFIEGSLIVWPDGDCSIARETGESKVFSELEMFRVDPETVDEYTGLEKDGKPVFEGDIVELTDDYHTVYGVVKYGKIPASGTLNGRNVGFYIEWLSEGMNDWAAWFRNDLAFWLELESPRENVQIVGNIHDCKDLPALLEAME